MPTYSYSCPCCHAEFDRVMRVAEYTPAVPCACGGGSALRVYKPETAPRPNFFRAYATDNFTPEPIEIGSPRQERELEKRYGVTTVEAGKYDEVRRKKPPVQVSKQSFRDDVLMVKQKLGL